MTDSQTVLRDAFRLLCNEQIGQGMSREVYRSPLMPNAVVKVEDAARMFQNVVEWETWMRVRDTKAGRWFAPCLHISACGSVLVMARTRPAPKPPNKLPVFLTDTKLSNYGLYEGRFVCHDYGTHLLMEEGMSKRTRPVEWWDE